ncbi:uncharacterized protein PG998_003312 [Apiospora kogelbergensis]|uniref:uncharacterized protein n=1 Tax=Apiospora kogelbergensis TaxID=1337665 RepID=UPI003131DA0B
MDRITAQAWHYYQAQPHPSELAQAEQSLKRGIDEDWRSSVQRYPEVLEYFYSLVELSLPQDDDGAVRDPPLSALTGGSRKTNRRSVQGPPLPNESFEREAPPPRHAPLPSRTPPPFNRRTPGPPIPMPPMGMSGIASVPPPSSRRMFRPPAHSTYYGYP